MSKNVTVQIDTRKLNDIIKKLPGNRDKAIRAIAFSIERKAKVNCTKLQLVDTGALRASIYTRTSRGSFVNGREITGLPELPERADPNLPRETLPTVRDGEAVIGPSVEYGIYHEFGARRVRSRPFLGPAVNSTAKELEEHLKDVCTGGE